MKEKITICKPNSSNDGRLSVIGWNFLPVHLSETDMELYAKYQGESYRVQGSIYCQYIVVKA